MNNNKLLDLMKIVGDLLEQGATITSFSFDHHHKHQSVYISKPDFIRLHKGKTVTISQLGIMSYGWKVNDSWIRVQCLGAPTPPNIEVTIGDEHE
tara:strand:- start:8523 stop:8807 length:285 start_codon:yes stop_codon:yes gene_type:complete